jgi:hypothetical protein
MNRRLIGSGSVFEERIGYSRAVVAGDWVFVSGTTGFDYATMSIPEGVVEQARQCLANIERALHEAGGGLPGRRARHLHAAGGRGLRALLAGAAPAFRRRSSGGDHDLRAAGGSANEDRDRGHRLEARVIDGHDNAPHNITGP